MGLLDSILGSALGGSEATGRCSRSESGPVDRAGDHADVAPGRCGTGRWRWRWSARFAGQHPGGAGGGAASGGLGGVLGDLLGGAAGGAGQAAPGVEAGSLGGLGGLFQMLQNAGLGDALNSWIGGGPNQSVSAADISRVFGDGQLQQLADSAGVSQGEAAEHLSSLLPELVNKLTPDGQAPQGDLDIGLLLARFS